MGVSGRPEAWAARAAARGGAGRKARVAADFRAVGSVPRHRFAGRRGVSLDHGRRTEIG